MAGSSPLYVRASGTKIFPIFKGIPISQQLLPHSKSSSTWKVNDNIVKGRQCEELQVLDALATLLVRNHWHEVVGVSADHSGRDVFIQVIACARLCNEATHTSDTKLNDKDGIYYATSHLIHAT
jgi:hypothetical protein